MNKTVAPFEIFRSSLEQAKKIEEKIRLCLDFMKEALEQAREYRFKDFWDAKKICLDLFKEFKRSPERVKLWEEYTELVAKAKRLKDILDEEADFAVEQIDLAISALEKDLDAYEALLEQMPKIRLSSLILQKREAFYSRLQQELDLLNTLAARVTDLRKEMIKTEMRIRYKNRFFERLSAAGDKIFPKRKEKIKEISDAFVQDVTKNLIDSREEIQELQKIAKDLSLDPRSFTESRLHLGKSWDLLKEKDKELGELSQKNFMLMMDKIKPLAEKCQKEGCTFEEAEKLAKEITNAMRNLDLGREQTARLKAEILLAKKPVLDRLKKEQEERDQKLQEAQRQKREKYEGLCHEIEEVLAREMPVDEIDRVRAEYAKKAKALSLSGAEKAQIEELLKKLRDRMIEKKEQVIAALSEEAKGSLEQLKAVLKERKAQRDEIRSQLEQYRKELSGSGFDFEKAIRYQELIEAEKERLDKANEAIEEIDDKIADLED